LWFAHLARALVVFPGGFGTLDELSEILTLAQTRKLPNRIPVVLYGPEYWREVVNFDALVRHGTISAEDLQLFEWADEPHAALELLKRCLPVGIEEACPAFAHTRSHGRG
jgi:predicted Rossmann-fold nucleotide-binding protein